MTGRGRPILVLDGQARQALTVVRALGEAGWAPEVASQAPAPIAGLSRYASATHVLPDPRIERARFVDAVVDLAAQGGYALVIPVTDWSIVPLLAERERVEAHAPLALPPTPVAERTLSKSATIEAARRVGVPVPETWVAATSDDPLPDSPARRVVKTDRSKGWEGGYAWEAPAAYAHTVADTQDLVQAHLARGRGPVVVQRYVNGWGVAMAVLASEGELLARFQYRRLHEVPVSGGASSYRISELIDPVLEELVRALLAELKWTGVAMVEFKRRTDGGYALLEVNGRFWGSLALPYHAGVPFAAWLADLLVDGRRSFPTSYRVGVRARAMAPEVEWIKENLLRSGDPRTTTYPPTARFVVDLARLAWDRWDTLSLRDPVPFAVEAARTLEREARHAAGKLRRSRVTRQMLRRRGSAALADRLRDARSVVLVCHGNIVRSAYAEARLRAELPPDDPLEITSAGLWAHPATPAHPWAQERAAGALATHRARALTPEMARASHLVLLMTASDVLTCRRRYANHDGVLLLGCLLPDGELEFADPIDDARADFDTCFDRIDEAVAALARARTRRL